DQTWTLAAAGAQDVFGAGCAGSAGVPTVSANANSIAQPGGVVAFDVDNVPNSLAILAAGFSRTVAGGQPLPLSLAPFGMPGCSLLVSPDVAVLLAAGANAATWWLPLPSVPGLLGVEFYVQ